MGKENSSLPFVLGLLGGISAIGAAQVLVSWDMPMDVTPILEQKCQSGNDDIVSAEFNLEPRQALRVQGNHLEAVVPGRIKLTPMGDFTQYGSVSPGQTLEIKTGDSRRVAVETNVIDDGRTRIVFKYNCKEPHRFPISNSRTGFSPTTESKPAPHSYKGFGR